MARPKPHRRLPKPKRAVQPWDPTGLKGELLAHRTNKPRPKGAVTTSELVRDVLAFLAERYDGRHLDIEVAQLGLSNAAQRLIVKRLQAVGSEVIHHGKTYSMVATCGATSGRQAYLPDKVTCPKCREMMWKRSRPDVAG